jgi:hypothetical protein
MSLEMNERTYYSQEAADRARRNRITLATVAFSLGAGVGAMVALLLAPSSGEKLRNTLTDTLEDSYGDSRRAVEDAYHNAKDRVT